MGMNKPLPPPPDWRMLQFESFDKQADANNAHCKHLASLEITIKCPTHGTGHIRMGCRHVTTTPIDCHPGMVVHPDQYIVCADCWKLIQRKKFNFGRELGTVCKECLNDLGYGLAAINPEKILDLRRKKA